MWKLMDNIIEKDDVDALVSFLQTTDRFTNGPKVSKFEAQWSEWLGIEKSVMVNSGASGNYLSIALVKELFGVGEVLPYPRSYELYLLTVSYTHLTLPTIYSV